MEGRHHALPQRDRGAAAQATTAEVMERLAALEPSRLGRVMAAVVARLHGLASELHATPAEMRALVAFLTEVGHHADARRQEWVLLADVLGLSALIETQSAIRPPGATPNTMPGPFYRPDAPDLPAGATICRDGKGVPLEVRGRVLSLVGGPVADALVEVWQANGEGKYENQDPDLQPEFNLRGRFRTDAQGRFRFSSVMPKGYRLPGDGPVGQLMARLGLTLERPAHIHFRVTARGHETLTTHIFDRADPAIARDAIFGVKPELLADFGPAGGAGPRSLDLDLTLCALVQG